VPEPRLVEVGIPVGKLKKYEFLGTDQIPAELMKAGDKTLFSDIRTYSTYME
jgi:hypothetical protein